MFEVYLVNFWSQYPAIFTQFQSEFIRNKETGDKYNIKLQINNKNLNF